LQINHLGKRSGERYAVDKVNDKVVEGMLMKKGFMF
jgi:hypothetical protein